MQQIDCLEKIKRWCAYQDRSHFETFNKLKTYGVTATEAEEIMAELISHNFLNEERFARSFARGKFRIKHWGRYKILFELRKHKIPENIINIALTEISEDEYMDSAERVFKKLNIQYKGEYQKVRQNLYGKGFEPEIIDELIKRGNCKNKYAN